MSYRDRVRARLAALDDASLRRTVRDDDIDPARDFRSNDYLGMARHPDVVAALRSATRVGSGGSRLLAGAHAEHAELERALAAWTGREDALLFSSGYLAVLGTIGALAPHFIAAYSDADNHACAIDALRLTKLARTVYPHRALQPLTMRVAPALVVTESRFGMRATRADLAAVVASLDANDALVVDEAHALGIDGVRGAGLAHGLADERIVVVATLSKALGAAGGFAAGPAEVIDLLRNDARGFVFDTAMPPSVAAAAHAALTLVIGDEGDRRRAQLARNAARVRAHLSDLGFAVRDEGGAIVPIVVGEARAALSLSRALAVAGMAVPAIRPPTVARGEAMLRITLRADHDDAAIDALLAALADAVVASA